MTMKHTPGPWVVEEVLTYSGRAFRIGAGDMLRSGKGCCIIYDDYVNGKSERRANAYLISAAPDMLEALGTLATAASAQAEFFRHQARDATSEIARVNVEAAERWEKLRDAAAAAILKAEDNR